MFSRLFLALILLVAAALLLFPPPMLNLLQSRTLAIVLVTLTLWASSALPQYLTSLLFFLAAILLQVATPASVFSGFASAAFWLIFAGLVIGMAIRSTGLGDRMAALLGRHLAHSYTWLICGLMLCGTLLGFVMPSSMGRAVMMVPIAMALAERCGFAPGSQGRIGVALAVAFGCHVPTFTILPSNIPNMVLSGTAETIYGVHISYTDYLWLHFPVLGLLKAAVIAALILWRYPAQVAAQTSAVPATASHDPALQRRLSLILLVALGFWLTDSLHGINPAWVGLAAACLLLMPKIGMVSADELQKQMNISMLLFVAGVLALGALVNSSGLGSAIAGAMMDWLPLQPGEDLQNFLSLSGLAFITGLIATLPGVPAVLTPMAGELAQHSGWTVPMVLMTQVVGFSTILFPYQSGPLIVGMQLCKEPLRELLKITVPLTLISLLVLMPLDYLWWWLTGQFSALSG